MNNYKQAIRILDKGTQAFPNFEEGFFYKGKLCLRIGEISLAAEAFSRSLHINPFNELGTRSLIQLHYFQEIASNRWEKQIKPCRNIRGCSLKGKSIEHLLQRESPSSSYKIIMPNSYSNFLMYCHRKDWKVHR